MPPTSQSVRQPRQQKFGKQLETEWPEWRPFPYMFKKKHLIKAQRIQVEIHWAKLTGSPNAKVTTTREEGHSVAKGLALLDDYYIPLGRSRSAAACCLHPRWCPAPSG